MAELFILDASAAFTLASISGDGTGGLDSLFEGDRRSGRIDTISINFALWRRMRTNPIDEC